MSEHSIPEMTADELRAIARELSAYVELRPGEGMLDPWQFDVARSLLCLRGHQPCE
jgi:hypothetical protein